MTDQTTHRIVVEKPEWRLSKRTADGWEPCHRDDPDDLDAFAVADEGDWLAMPDGTYEMAFTKVGP